VPDVDTKATLEDKSLAHERLIASALLSDSYADSDDRIKDVVEELSSGALSHMWIRNTSPDRLSVHVLEAVLGSLHILDTDDHKRVIGQIVEQAEATLSTAENEENSIEKVRALRERASTALFEDYADINLVRTFDEIHTRQTLGGEVFSRAYLLAGIVLVLAEEKYSPETSDN